MTIGRARHFGDVASKQRPAPIHPSARRLIQEGASMLASPRAISPGAISRFTAGRLVSIVAGLELAITMVRHAAANRDKRTA
jgi:hypothetical protein